MQTFCQLYICATLNKLGSFADINGNPVAAAHDQSVCQSISPFPAHYAAHAGQGRYYGPSMFGGTVEEQQPSHAYVWKMGRGGVEPDLES